MPELPEVETVARGLRRHLVGRTFTGVSIHWHKTVQSPDAATFCRALCGRRVVDVSRRGKYILLVLDDGRHLAIHLRMTGRLMMLPGGSARNAHTRAVWTLDDGSELHFTDMRKFGRVALLDAEGMASLESKLGPEPLAELTTARLAEQIRRRTIAIKAALLDQHLVAGVGNIYADETLFAAGIHPQRPANSLSDEEIERLHQAMRTVLASAVERSGTTLEDEQFRGVQGESGENQHHLAVFRRTGKPCPRCGATIERVRIGGRSTHFCPRCQK